MPSKCADVTQQAHQQMSNRATTACNDRRASLLARRNNSCDVCPGAFCVNSHRIGLKLTQERRRKPLSFTRRTIARSRRGCTDASSACYVLHRIFVGRKQAFHHERTKLAISFSKFVGRRAAGMMREEAAIPSNGTQRRTRTYVCSRRLCACTKFTHSRCGRSETRHPAVVRDATGRRARGDVAKPPYESTVKLGVAELERRFDPNNPDWTLLDLLLRASHDAARELGERWLRITAPLWTRDVARMMAWLMSPQAGTRFITAELSIAAISADEKTRIALAQQVFGLLQGGQIKVMTSPMVL